MRSSMLWGLSWLVACGADAAVGGPGSESGETGTAAQDDGADDGQAESADDGSTGDGGADAAGSESGEPADDDGGDDGPSSDPLDGLPTGQDQWELLCARNHDDAIARAFCAGEAPPPVDSITGLLDLLGIGFIPGNLDNGKNGNPGFTLASHSTAISTRSINPINPRAFVFTPPIGGVVFPPSGIPNPDLVMMGFGRGEPFVELVARDATDGELRFYLFRFVPPCEDTDDGCNNADLLTPAIESGFVDYSLYDDGDVGNTVLDCLQCHQPDGPGTPKLLRMQEFVEGWTHWYYPNRPQNREAMQMFVDAHAGESYGGIPAEFLTHQMLLENGEGSAVPLAFEQTIRNEGFATQPNEFASQQIMAERNNAGCTCTNCPTPPPLDPTSSCSPTWDALFASTVGGDAIATPYFDGHIVDLAKLAPASAAYRDTMDGLLPADQLPDIRDVLLDEAAPYMSLAPAPGLDGRGILTHMCQHCHNSSLDQSLTRSNFNVEELDLLPQSVKDKAIERLQLPDDDIDKMPPQRFHSLSQDEIDAVIAELSP